MPVYELPRFADCGGRRTIRSAGVRLEALIVAAIVAGHDAAPRIVPGPDCPIQPREAMQGIYCLQTEKVETVMSGANSW
jgi:hypothetical protein